MLELFVDRGQSAAKRRSLLWVWCKGDWRHKSAIKHNVTLRPDAVIHFSASSKCVLVSPRVKATVPRHRWTGCGPRLRQSRLVALRPQCLARQLSGLPCVVWCQARPTIRASVRAICGSGAARLSSASKVATMATTRMAMTTAMAARTRSLCKVTLKQYLTPIGAAD